VPSAQAAHRGAKRKISFISFISAGHKENKQNEKNRPDYHSLHGEPPRPAPDAGDARPDAPGPRLEVLEGVHKACPSFPVSTLRAQIKQLGY